jgi:adenylate cyclase
MGTDLAGGRVLVVDDDRVNRMLLTRSLEHEGHRVRCAENGAEALELLHDDPCDVVLLDIVMPELDGVSVLEHMKRDHALQDVPVIMISGVDDTESVVRCIEIGADDYLPKPFDPVLLRARISAGLTKKRLHELERERLRGVFARFLPEPMVDEVLLRADGDLRLGGVRLVSTALFADLRGFTGFAERTPPDDVIAVLNRYFGEMSDAVLDNGGTLVAFLGDGLIAVFGAPIECDDHADRAVAAAREMLGDRLPRFNDWAREQGYGEPFRMGIGMSSGPLMSGNVGSERRLEYTAIGDTVNTASRIESLTKKLGHPVLLSESTLDLLTTPSADLVYVDEVTVRGRSAPTRVWGLPEPAGSPYGGRVASWYPGFEEDR